MKKKTADVTEKVSETIPVEKKASVFEKLSQINLNEHVEKRKDLTYISWVYAWAEAKKVYPDITYKIIRYGENQLPYVYDENTGYMVSTEITVNKLTHSMWLPVLDSSNKAMKNKPYKYNSKYGFKTVEPASMFDINKAIMRCLVKNLAMFGLGLYIYAGEDLPMEIEKDEPTEEAQIVFLKMKLMEEISKYGDSAGKLRKKILESYGVGEIHMLTKPQIEEALMRLKSKPAKPRQTEKVNSDMGVLGNEENN